jgi:integrase
MRGSVYRRGKTWTAHLSWQQAGQQRQTKKGGYRTKGEAESGLDELSEQVRKGGHVPTGRRSFGQYLDSWLDSLVVAGRRPSTIDSYRRQVEAYIRPALGGIGLKDLSALDIDGLYASMTERGLSPRTIRFTHSILRKSLADAERKGIVTINVATKSSPPSSSAARAPEAATWTPEQLRQFLAQTKEHHHGALIRLAAMTGLRRGELCGLRWSDTDLERASLSVVQTITTVDHKPVLGDVKTGSSRRVVDLDQTTVEVLRRHQVAQKKWRLSAGEGWKDTGLVFVMPDGSGWNPDTITQAFERLVAVSDLPRITLHGLRHSHTTHLLASGMNPRLVSARLGHASVAFTLDRYGHVMPGQQAEAAAAVAALVDGA